MLLTLLPQAVIAEDPGGAADLTITTLEDLEAFRAEVDSGNTFEGQLVELTADIDLSAKTAVQFASGDVARLLQDGQTAGSDGVKPQIWGQTLSGETPDAYPVLTADSAKTVVKVSFMTVGEREASYTEHAVAYTNTGCTVILPKDPMSDEYKFVRWSQTQSADGAEFTAQTTVNGDMTV